MKIKRRKTNGFEYSVLGIDLLIKYIIEKIYKKKRKSKFCINRKSKCPKQA